MTGKRTRKLEALATRFLALAEKRRTIGVFPHVGMDGDALGSALALCRLFDRLGLQSVLIADEAVPSDLVFLPDAERVQVFQPDGDWRQIDFGLACDCHEAARLNRRADLFRLLPETGAIDHHQGDDGGGPLLLVDPTASSTAELVFDLFLVLTERTAENLLDGETARQLLAGLVSDTGRFSYSNVTPHTLYAAARLLEYEPGLPELSFRLFDAIDLPTLRLKGYVYARTRPAAGGCILSSTVPLRLIKACNSEEYALNTLASDLRNVEGVDVVFLLRETSTKGEIRVNIRTTEALDAAAFAQELGGGGHTRAAGLTLSDTSLEEARSKLIRRAAARLS